MYKTFTVNPKELSDTARNLTDERFVSVERVLAKRSEIARLSMDINKETKQRHGRIFAVTCNLSVDSNRYTATASADTLEQAIDMVRDDMLRLVRSSRGKAMRLLRKGGAKIKKLLRFDHSSE